MEIFIKKEKMEKEAINQMSKVSQCMREVINNIFYKTT
jgi:hypothetical protein